MTDIPSFLEDKISQVPALQVLINLGFEYIPPEEAFRLRGSKSSNVLLDEVLEQQLVPWPVHRLRHSRVPALKPGLGQQPELALRLWRLQLPLPGRLPRRSLLRERKPVL